MEQVQILSRSFNAHFWLISVDSISQFVLNLEININFKNCQLAGIG